MIRKSIIDISRRRGRDSTAKSDNQESVQRQGELHRITGELIDFSKFNFRIFPFSTEKIRFSFVLDSFSCSCLHWTLRFFMDLIWICLEIQELNSILGRHLSK